MQGRHVYDNKVADDGTSPGRRSGCIAPGDDTGLDKPWTTGSTPGRLTTARLKGQPAATRAGRAEEAPKSRVWWLSQRGGRERTAGRRSSTHGCARLMAKSRWRREASTTELQAFGPADGGAGWRRLAGGSSRAAGTSSGGTGMGRRHAWEGGRCGSWVAEHREALAARLGTGASAAIRWPAAGRKVQAGRAGEGLCGVVPSGEAQGVGEAAVGREERVRPAAQARVPGARPRWRRTGRGEAAVGRRRLRGRRQPLATAPTWG
jgi:hypothetical protein